VAASSLPVSEPRASVDLHLLALTGLRIFPALAVYFSHLAIPEGSPPWLVRTLQSGYYGVTVFFVLSGFVLTINYWDRLIRPTGRAVWSYTVARLARIFPLYLAVIAYVAFRSRVVDGSVPDSWPWHLVGLQAWLPNVFDVDAFGPSWSLSVEFFLYAMLPLLILGLRGLVRIRQLVLATLITVFVMLALAWWFEHAGRADLPLADAASAHRWLYRTPITRLGDFILGILAARLYMQLRGYRRAVRLGATAAIVSVVVIGFFTTQSWMFLSAYSWDVAYAVPAVVLITGLALAPRAPLARFLATGPIVFLGEASYAFYLIHLSIAGLYGANALNLGVNRASLGLGVLSLGLVLATSIGLHIALERPARVWVRRILDPRRPPPARSRELDYYG
jgi:peptidoglycan/LPS O-acetylase OafA/YrhL